MSFIFSKQEKYYANGIRKVILISLWIKFLFITFLFLFFIIFIIFFPVLKANVWKQAFIYSIILLLT